MPENQSNSRRTGSRNESELSDEQLEKAAGGAWQQVKEIAIQDIETVDEPNETDMEFLKQRAARNG